VPETSTATEAETLDQVYKAFNVEESAAQFRPQVQAPQQPQPPQQSQAQPQGEVVPDPVMDPAGYKAWASRNSEATQNALRAISGQLAGFAQQQARVQEENDIRAAVTAVKNAGFEAEDDFIEIALGQKVRKDPKFLAVYQNRSKNPQAWGRALAAFSNEAKGKYAFKTDETLAANVRAAKASTNTTQAAQASENKNSLDKFLEESKDPREFEARWRQIVHGSTM